MPHLPIKALDWIGEHHAGNGRAVGQGNFKRIALHATGNRTKQGKYQFDIYTEGV